MSGRGAEDGKGPERVTIRHVAAEAGVGVGTASRALSGSQHVSEATRRQVEEAASRLGFEFNALARGLSRGRSGMVGVLLSDIRSPYLAEVVFAAESRLRELGLGIIIADTANSVSVQTATTGLRNGRIDGLISLIPMTDEEIEAFNCPIVFADRPRQDGGHDSVTFDNHSGGAQAAAHLLGVGCSSLAIVDSPATPATLARREGFLEAAPGVAVERVFIAGRGIQGGREAAATLLARGVPFDGVFATNDMLALGIIQELASEGIRVPEDVAVIGFDGTYVGTISAPTLTTIFQDATRLGSSVATLLAERIEGRTDTPVSSLVLPVSLVARTSTARADGSRASAVAESVLFDCDGVLVDSEDSIQRCWTQWAEEYGVDARAVIAAVPGRRAPDVIAEFVPGSAAAEALARIERLEIDDAANVRAIPGAAELISAIPEGRWAVVTSGTSPLATARLRAAGLPIPPVLIGAGDVERGKPDPEGYLAGARRIGADLSRTAVLEDSGAGIRAAVAARVGTIIAVGPVVTDGITARVPDLTALAWADGRFLVRESASV